jgi:CRP/FNR family transcriptional regulator, anaerobic regulatory protein
MAKSPSGVRSQLLLGRQQLEARFRSKAAPLTVRAGEKFASPADARCPIHRLRTGWAGQCRELASGRRAIVDVYLPGDLIGLDALFRTRPLVNVLALTFVETEAIDADGEPTELFASQCLAVYIAWSLGHRQRRADRLLTAISCLDARGRVAMMLLDFYKRLRARKLIATKTYNMPLTQQHIGNYLGLTVVHINRVLRSLRDERIACLERNCVTILDLERLTLLAQQPAMPDIPDKLDPKSLVPSENLSSNHTVGPYPFQHRDDELDPKRPW